ncbi:HDIG domain-containing protein [Pseudodesulfovibrio sp. JC047]|uniref:HDIG domain-containing metalloprotein n=1 Tax=Pseudodesulfovibrio sp. JC047 TaxID=2683199 RepID=UPI0013D48C84|nr:HDIG domain-containing metalloprotein [Pseudodesulfovibrio sp. JC047]NDV17970.1 HDIG domain-containing protein [Pseudodesulfovibrio sp. JC047]
MSEKDTSDIATEQYGSPLTPPPAIVFDPVYPVPDDAQCAEYWAYHDMLDNVADHSRMVANIATFMAQRAKEVGLPVDVPTVRASALLHDIAKTYCILHGGNHSQLGGAWAMDLTRNPIIASGVTHHVYWPFELDVEKYFTPLAVIYADKRVNHTDIVSIEERFKDLIKRYGIPLNLMDRIKATEDQALSLEKQLCDTLKVDLNACDFDSWRLV